MGGLRRLRHSGADVWCLPENAIHLLPILEGDTMRENLDRNNSCMDMSSAVFEPQRTQLGERVRSKTEVNSEVMRDSLFTLKRVASFFTLITVLVFGLNATITSGLRRIKTGQYGVSNRIMQGKVNAQVIINGSSRALSHFDPRIIEAQTGHSAFNLGRNGSQTDMQVAVLKAYLEHNRAPEVVIHSLDSFSFEATRKVYNPAQYVPYLYDEELYKPLHQFDRNIWRSRYLPLYGYVVDDMSFSWILGLGALSGWSPPEDFFLGFNPRSKKWTDEFQRFKSGNPRGVRWPIDPEGMQSVEDLIRLCQQHGIQLIFVYSPEYVEMQKLTKNRAEVFDLFHGLAGHYHVPLWDYSDWKYAADTQLFQNSQHLNAEGAELFSEDVANRLKGYFAVHSQTAPNLQASR
jgi:hypothetical protein